MTDKKFEPLATSQFRCHSSLTTPISTQIVLLHNYRDITLELHIVSKCYRVPNSFVQEQLPQ